VTAGKAGNASQRGLSLISFRTTAHLNIPLNRPSGRLAALSTSHDDTSAKIGHFVVQGTIIIYVDADACPVKAEVYKVAQRHGLKVLVVANSYIQTPRDPMIERIVVSASPDAVDNWIVARLTAGSIVITTDVPLASRSIKRAPPPLPQMDARFRIIRSE
jgi:Uncharacterized BCR, YaiI/YqxD family COG1671